MELAKNNSFEIISTRKNKPSLVLNGYEHRVHRKTDKCITWLCSKERSEKCRGGLKTDLHHNVLNMTTHSCVPNFAKIEAKKTIERCKERIREELSSPVSQIFKEEVAEFYNKGYHLLAEAPKYENVKSSLCQERRRVLRGETQNSKNSSESELWKEAECLLEHLNNSTDTTISDDNNEKIEAGGNSSRLNETPEHVECSVDYHPSQFSEDDIAENKSQVQDKKGKTVNTQKKRKLQSPERHVVAQYTNSEPVKKDEFMVYAEYVANELRKLSVRSQAVAKHKIGNILFKATIGSYDSPSTSDS